MTIERRTDYLWGILKGEPEELCKGSVISWDIAKGISQEITVETPDILSIRRMYPGKPSFVTLFQDEINYTDQIYERRLDWKDVLRGRVEKIKWVEDNRPRGKKLFNPVFSPSI